MPHDLTSECFIYFCLEKKPRHLYKIEKNTFRQKTIAQVVMTEDLSRELTTVVGNHVDMVVTGSLARMIELVCLSIESGGGETNAMLVCATRNDVAKAVSVIRRHCKISTKKYVQDNTMATDVKRQWSSLRRHVFVATKSVARNASRELLSETGVDATKIEADFSVDDRPRQKFSDIVDSGIFLFSLAAQASHDALCICCVCDEPEDLWNCRFCAKPEAKRMCSRCSTRYCDAQCQRLDWTRHKLECNKIPRQ